MLDEALSLGDQERWEEMADLLASALEIDPDEPYVLCWLGVAERELGNDGSAYEYFRRCVAQEPLDPQLLAVAGSGLAAFDDPEAEHLRENVRSELFGTTDVREAIEGGIPWNPPDGPTPEGASGVDELDEPPEATIDDR